MTAIWVLAAFAVGLAAGFVAGWMLRARDKPKATAYNQQADAAAVERAARAIREYQNFLNYNGTEQEDILL